MIKFRSDIGRETLLDFDKVEAVVKKEAGLQINMNSSTYSVHEDDIERVWDQYEDYLLNKRRALLRSAWGTPKSDKEECEMMIEHTHKGFEAEGEEE